MQGVVAAGGACAAGEGTGPASPRPKADPGSPAEWKPRRAGFRPSPLITPGQPGLGFERVGASLLPRSVTVRPAGYPQPLGGSHSARWRAWRIIPAIVADFPRTRRLSHVNQIWQAAPSGWSACRVTRLGGFRIWFRSTGCEDSASLFGDNYVDPQVATEGPRDVESFLFPSLLFVS